MSKTNHFPFPEYNSGAVINEIIYPDELTDELERLHYQRGLSKEVQFLKSQYFLIESEFIKTFDFVYPARTHLYVYSSKYALIINNACNLFETVSRAIYKQIYAEDDIDIYNYLSLDKHLEFRKVKIKSPLFKDEFIATDILKPFEEFSWTRSRPMEFFDLPNWWRANYEMKDEPTLFPKYATMQNAIRALAATAILMYIVYGPGITMGDIGYDVMTKCEKSHYNLNNRKSQLFDFDEGAK